MTLMDYRLACVVLVLWHVGTLGMEWWIFALLYDRVESLQKRGSELQPLNAMPEGVDEKRTKALPLAQPSLNEQKKSLLSFPSISAYWRQSSFYAAFGLALVFLTVLCMGKHSTHQPETYSPTSDGASISYAKVNGLSDDTIGLFSSASSALGFVAAVTYPCIVGKFRVKWTAFVGLIVRTVLIHGHNRTYVQSQNVCLWLCVLSIRLPGSLTSLDALFSPAGQHQTPAVINSTSTAHSQTPEHPPTSVLFYLSGIVSSRFGE